MPTYFISHGIGPWSFMHGPLRENFAQLEQYLTSLPSELPAPPKAVVVVSGHWQEAEFTVANAARPGMLYDYGGFPSYTYEIQYPAPGSPTVAARIQELLGKSGRKVAVDPQRGFDAATFAILKPMYPRADMPIVQLSVKAGLDPAEHFAVGRTLAPLRDAGILLIGSGFSYHNLRLRGRESTAPSLAFDGWLRQSLLVGTADERLAALANWTTAPHARIAHPQEEHLIPLMVAAGAGGDDPATAVYGEMLMGSTAVSSFRFGADRRRTGFDRLGATAKAV